MSNFSLEGAVQTPQSNNLTKSSWEGIATPIFWYVLELLGVIILIVVFKFRFLRTPRGSIYLLPSKNIRHFSKVEDGSKIESDRSA